MLSILDFFLNCCLRTLPYRWDTACIVSTKWLPLKHCKMCLTFMTAISATNTSIFSLHNGLEHLEWWLRNAISCFFFFSFVLVVRWRQWMVDRNFTTSTWTSCRLWRSGGGCGFWLVRAGTIIAKIRWRRLVNREFWQCGKTDVMLC